MNYQRLAYKRRKLMFFLMNIKLKTGSRKQNKYNPKIIISSFTLLIFMLIGLIIPNNIKAYSDENCRNDFYIKILNFTIPTIKVNSYQAEEHEKALVEKVFSILGLDNDDPLSIIKKEIPYLYKNDYTIGDRPIPKDNGEPKQVNNDTNSNNGENGFCINPFKLNENEISKVEDTSNESSSNSVVNVYDPKLKKNLNKFKPEVLIYHSHTCESYAPGDDRKINLNENIWSVGEALTKELQVNYGISVIHDKTYHDLDYNASYKLSRDTLDKYLKQYGDFKIIIDMHRDANKNKKAVTAKFNGENVARFNFVMTTGNPHFKKNMILVDKMIDVGNSLYPGIMKSNGVYLGRQIGIKYYNQDKSNNAVLIEIGSEVNTLEEAKSTQKYLARIIAEALK